MRSPRIANLGLGKYGLIWPINWKMFAFVVSPTIGRAVSKGLLATKEPVGPNGAGFVSARKGASPVAVGPNWLVRLINYRKTV